MQGLSVTLQGEALEKLLPELVRALRGAEAADAAIAPPPAPPEAVQGAEADLTEGQARDFLRACGSKSMEVLRWIATRPKPEFRGSEINAILGNLDGVWGGLTKRVRTITGDRQAILLSWKPEFRNGKQIDGIAKMSPVTFASFRKALEIA